MPEPLLDQRYAPPQAHVEDVPELAGGPMPATRGERLRAALVDVVIAVATFWGGTWLADWQAWAAAESWQTLVVNGLIGYVLFALVHGWLLARHGQTVGKRVVGIRITRTDGSRASLLRLLGLRYGVGYVLTMVPKVGQVFGLVDTLMIFRASRRCLHDVIADTVVLKA